MKFNKTTGKIFEDDPNVRIKQKDLVSQIEKDKMADQWIKNSGYDYNAPSLDDEIKKAKDVLHYGQWLEKQKEENKSPLPSGMGNKYKSDIRTANAKKKDAYDEKKYGIKQRLKNVRGPHVAELIYKGMSPQEKGSHNAEQRRNKLDNHFDPGVVSGRPFPTDAFILPTDQEPRTLEDAIKPIRKNADGLSEDFVIQKLREKSILK